VGYNFHLVKRLCCILLLAFGSCALAASKPSASPNVVFITIDTLRPDHLGCYGYKQIHTPNIDALAADGARLTRAYTSVPVTLPSHTIIFTGTYPMLSGVHDFAGNRIGASQQTLASTLKQAGYSTGAVVGSAVLDSRFGLNRGFDFYYDHFDFNRLQESNLDEMERPGNVVADIALDWLSKNADKKFFLWMHLYDPHFPYRPPSPYSEQYKDRPYDGEIAFADAQVGRLLQFLKEKQLYQNTLIVLSGDHGESLGEHGEETHGFFIYNSTLHVPLIIHLPGRSSAQAIPDLANLADVMPTTLHVLKLGVPSQVQGKNLLDVLDKTSTNDSRDLYAESFLPRLHFNWSELRGLETANYHYIDAPRPELYDLSKDPGETLNLFGEKKAVAEEMRNRLQKTIATYSASQELAEKTGLDPVLMERLKSLGYAGFSGGSTPAPGGRPLPDPKDRIETYELFSAAMSESQHGDFANSSEKLEAVLKTDPDSVPAHYLLGLNLYRTGDFVRSVSELERVVQLSPDYALAIYQLGLSYARAGRLGDSIQTLKRALALDGTNFSAAYNLGAAYLQQKQIPEATAAFRQAVTINPDYAQGHLALGEMLLYQNAADEALVELQRAEELAPENAATHKALARAFTAKGMIQQAEAEMRKAQTQR
jgi:arylsulfatase A-like enzyme/cytochrome c-type biogenesis protein CcmH/NrfG